MREMKKEMTECLASARTIYRKLKHLHQVHWELCRILNNGIWHIAVAVPSRNALYVWYDYNHHLVSISLDDEDNFTAYENYDLKLFIKTMKKILRRKSFDLRSE